MLTDHRLHTPFFGALKLKRARVRSGGRKCRTSVCLEGFLKLTRPGLLRIWEHRGTLGWRWPQFPEPESSPFCPGQNCRRELVPGSLHRGPKPRETSKLATRERRGLLLSREKKLSEGHLKDQKERGNTVASRRERSAKDSSWATLQGLIRVSTIYRNSKTATEDAKMQPLS